MSEHYRFSVQRECPETGALSEAHFTRGVNPVRVEQAAAAWAEYFAGNGAMGPVAEIAALCERDGDEMPEPEPGVVFFALSDEGEVLHRATLRTDDLLAA